MRIGVLYESDEWSDHKLGQELVAACGGFGQVLMVDMMQEDATSRALTCDLLVSRVFASAQFRGHGQALERMEELLARIEPTGIPLVNEPCAHRFEVDKPAATLALAEAGILVPQVYGVGLPEALGGMGMPCPVIIKPVCGGRTTCTAIARTPEEAASFLATAPDIPFMAQEYIYPVKGYVTRLEIIAGKPELVVKRSIADNGLSAYRFGSTYEMYPDCPAALLQAATRAAKALGFFFGSFDVIEGEEGAYFIDANSVSNVSEDCTETFGRDLMAEYAEAVAAHITSKQGNSVIDGRRSEDLRYEEDP